MVCQRGRGKAVEQLLDNVRGTVADFLSDAFASKEETWYARKCRDWSVL